MVARSISKAKFRAAAQGIYEVLWPRKFLNELRVVVKSSDKPYCDKKASTSISLNPICYDRIKYVKVDR